MSLPSTDICHARTHLTDPPYVRRNDSEQCPHTGARPFDAPFTTRICQLICHPRGDCDLNRACRQALFLHDMLLADPSHPNYIHFFAHTPLRSLEHVLPLPSMSAAGVCTPVIQLTPAQQCKGLTCAYIPARQLLCAFEHEKNSFSFIACCNAGDVQ